MTENVLILDSGFVTRLLNAGGDDILTNLLNGYDEILGNYIAK